MTNTDTKPKKKNTPIASPSKYIVGTVKKGTDNRLYVVKQYKTGQRWILVK